MVGETGIGPNTYGFGTLSDPDISIEYQKQPLSNGNYASTSANFAFFENGVLFIGINQVGGSSVGDESTRVRSNYEWVEAKMAQYYSQGMRAMVIFAHAQMMGARKRMFGYPFIKLMSQTYPDIPTLYLHGDGHNFGTEYPDRQNTNLVDLEVDGGEEADPLLISVMYDSATDKYSFNIDVRSGYYYGGCQTDNTDKTWPSSY